MFRKMKLLTLLVVFGCFFCWSGLALAQQTVFDKFEEVRKAQGAHLLGAAERVAYGLGERECSVFVLMLEDELKRRWNEANQPFLSFDFQQVMSKAFANGFDAARLDNIPDYNVKRLVREVLDSGYVIEEKDGHFYPWLDYGYLLRIYQNNINPEVKDYFVLCLSESALVSASGQSLTELCGRRLDFILQAEKYLRNYPDAYRKAAVVTIYKNRMSEYLVKTPDYAQAVIDGRVNESVLDSYKKAMQNSSVAGKLSGEVAQAWEAKNRLYNDQMHSFLADIDRRIDLVSTDHLKGIYFNNKGLDLFKPQGQKQYTILSGQVSPIARGKEQISGSGSNYLLLGLKGIMTKTLPVDIDNIPYPETFVVERVLGIERWELTDELFQADFVAFHGNPVWSLRILTNDEVIFETAMENLPYRFAYKPPVVASKNGREVYTYNLQNSFGGKTDILTVTISRQKVRDGLRGIDYDYKATVTLNGRKYEGYAFRQGQKPSDTDVLKAMP